MDGDEDNALTVAEILTDCIAMSNAALAKDFDTARRQARLIEQKARTADLPMVAAAALCATEKLGPSGGTPSPGYGEAIHRVASALDAFWFDAR